MVDNRPEVTAEKKRLNIDLLLIVIPTMAALTLYMSFQKQAVLYITGAAPVLLRTLFAAAFQFGVAGLGITMVSVLRKESFFSYGLRSQNSLRSLLLCVLCAVPNLVYTYLTQPTVRYLPFQSVWTTKELLASGFPVNMIGLLLTALVWGIFEGLNYVVICDKINKRFPCKKKWLNLGALVCAAACLLIHGAVGVTFSDLIGSLTVFIFIYGMLAVKEVTGNAWGCLFVFVFLWNAY